MDTRNNKTDAPLEIRKGASSVTVPVKSRSVGAATRYYSGLYSVIESGSRAMSAAPGSSRGRS